MVSLKRMLDNGPPGMLWGLDLISICCVLYERNLICFMFLVINKKDFLKIP